ncbi:hypothetical protein O181_015366 [Austropuccinia psidii MF-1]|uniref:Uncharacterized protein n=1 Tax=Austropuccinia psidii MF-1 TaxID=1389203 RepID=A0A9Q3BZU1_9BASI|nr:hypothetical protein [Austropuccinia psidii MF-1]
MDVTLDLDTRYHESQKEKNQFQEKKTEASTSSSSHTQNYSSSTHKKKNFRVHERDKPHSSLLNNDHNFMCSKRGRRLKEVFCAYCGGKHSLEAHVKRPQNQLTQPVVIDTPKGEELILGFDFLNHFNPSIDWRQGPITFNSDHKDYHDPFSSLINEFSSTNTFEALVGDSRIPSSPTSVHIPSPNSHQSLLSSRDEVFKEMKDV